MCYRHLGLSRALQKGQGHQRLFRDTTDIPGIPQICQEHSICVRDNTFVFKTPHVCRGNTDMSWISQACQDYHMSFRETLQTCWGHQRRVSYTRHMSGKQETFGDNTDGSETPLKCQGHQIAVKDTSDLLETVKLCQTPDTSQEHHGHQRPVGDSKDVSGIPHSCLKCVSQVYSVWTV